MGNPPSFRRSGAEPVGQIVGLKVVEGGKKVDDLGTLGGVLRECAAMADEGKFVGVMVVGLVRDGVPFVWTKGVGVVEAVGTLEVVKGLLVEQLMEENV